MHPYLLCAPVAGDRPRSLLLRLDPPAGRIKVVGELDRACAYLLIDVVDALAVTDQPVWTIDAAGISFCDAEGLRALAHAQAVLSRCGRRVHVVRATPWLVRLLRLVGMQALIDPSSGPVRHRSSPAVGAEPSVDRLDVLAAVQPQSTAGSR